MKMHIDKAGDGIEAVRVENAIPSCFDFFRLYAADPLPANLNITLPEFVILTVDKRIPDFHGRFLQYPYYTRSVLPWVAHKPQFCSHALLE